MLIIEKMIIAFNFVMLKVVKYNNCKLAAFNQTKNIMK